MFFENYWNAGSPQEQERYFDNVVISTSRIGCDCGDPSQARLDADQDGVPDLFESQQAAFEIGADDRARDSDGDGMSNADEFWAGTFADDPSSNLHLRQPTRVGTAFQFRFAAVRNRRYSIETWSGSPRAAWAPADVSELLGDGGDQRVEVPISAEDRQYFRVAVYPP